MNTGILIYVLWCSTCGFLMAQAVIEDPPKVTPKRLWWHYPVWAALANVAPLAVVCLGIAAAFCWAAWKTQEAVKAWRS